MEFRRFLREISGKLREFDFFREISGKLGEFRRFLREISGKLGEFQRFLREISGKTREISLSQSAGNPGNARFSFCDSLSSCVCNNIQVHSKSNRLLQVRMRVTTLVITKPLKQT